MKITRVLAYIVGCSATLAAAEGSVSADSTVYFVTSMAALPGKLQQAITWFDHQEAIFRSYQPAGQTALFSYASGNNIITVERYVDQHSALTWAFNQTHIEGCLGLFGLVDLFSSKLYSNINLDISTVVGALQAAKNAQ